MIATPKGQKPVPRTPQGAVEAEPYTPDRTYGPFRVNVGKHEQVDPGETRMDPVTGCYLSTLRDRNSPPFMSDKNLAAPQHEGGFGAKFSFVGDAADPETSRRPGESLADFAARMQALAASTPPAPSVVPAGAPVVNTSPAGTGPTDEALALLDAQTPDEVRKAAAAWGVDLAGLPGNVKRDQLVKHVRQVVREMYGRG